MLKNKLDKFKKIVDNLKHGFYKTKKTKEDFKKSDIDIDSLPETINYNIKLNQIVTFSFLFRTGVIILFLIYVGFIAISSLGIIYSIFTAFIISMALERVILFFSKFLPRGLGIIISYVMFFFFLILGFLILIPFLISYISEFIELLVTKVEFWQNKLETNSLKEIINSFNLHPFLKEKLLFYGNNPEMAEDIKNFIVENISGIAQNSAEYVKNISSFAISTIGGVLNILGQIGMVFVLAVFFSFEKDKVVYTIATLSQKPKKTAIKLRKLYFQLGEWLKGQVLLGFFIGISVYLGLLVLGWIFNISLDDKITLSLLAGLMEFIPYLGPILGAIPAVIVGVLGFGFKGFISVSILFMIIQYIEGFIVPIIMNRALGVSPLMILVAMLIGLKVMGIVGVILAIPLAVIISLLFEDSLKRKE